MKVTLCGALKCAMFARANSRSSLSSARALPENNEGVRRLAPAQSRSSLPLSTARARVAIRESRIGVGSAMTSPASVDDYGT